MHNIRVVGQIRQLRRRDAVGAALQNLQFAVEPAPAFQNALVKRRGGALIELHNDVDGLESCRSTRCNGSFVGADIVGFALGYESPCGLLVDEVADPLQHPVLEFHRPQTRYGRATQLGHKPFHDRGGQLCLVLQHGQQCLAVGGVRIVPGLTACRSNQERNGYRS